MLDTRIEGTVPEEAGMRSSPLESRLAVLEQRANTLLANLERERQAIETEKQEQKPEDKPITVGEIQVALNKLMASIAMAMGGVSNSINEKIRDIGNIYATQDQAKQFAQDAVPSMLRSLSTSGSADPTGGANPSAGNVVMVQPGGKDGQDSAYVGTIKGGTATTIEEVWAFGVKSIVGAVATFYSGPTMKGTHTEAIVPETSLTITAQGQIAFLSYSLITGLASFGLANASNFPLSGSGTYVKPLQSFNFAGGEASKLFTYHKGAVQIDSAYA